MSAGSSAVRAGQAYVELAAKDDKLMAGLAGVRKKLSGWGAGLGKVLSGPAGMLGIGLSFGSMIAVAGKAVNAARESIQMEMKLAAVLNATGGAVGLTKEELIDYAAQLQRVTNYDDEVTISAMALLATFKNIQGDAFKETIALAQDLASVTGEDLESAVRSLGKALSDPARGMMLLRRQGIALTESQQQQIKALLATNDVLGAQRVMLDSLQGRFGGAARAMADPFTQFKNQMGDVMEKLGMQMIPLLAAMSEKLSLGLEAGVDDASQLGSALEGVADVLQIMLQGLQAVWMVLKSLFTGLAFLVKLVSNALESMYLLPESLDDAIDEFYDKSAKGVEEGWKNVGEGFLSKTPSELAQQYRDRQAERMRKLKGIGAQPELAAAAAIRSVGPPQGMLFGSAQLAAAEAKLAAQGTAERQLIELVAIGRFTERAADTLDEINDADEDEVAEIPR